MPTKKNTSKKSSKKTVTKKTAKKTAKKISSKVASKPTSAATKKSTKKVSKKSTKKTTQKSRPQTAVYEMQHATPEQAFWLTSGVILHNLLDLRDALETMERSVFTHHVNQEKNDFADWVEHVLADLPCAQDLRQARGARPAYTVVVRHIKRYHN